MSQPQQNSSDEDPTNPIARALAQNWDLQVNNDQKEIDFELLAAYAEGRLTESEQKVVEELVANSPAALEALLFFHRALNVEQGAVTNDKVSTGSVDSTSIEIVPEYGGRQATPIEGIPPRRSSMRRPNALTLAALMLAAGASFWAYKTGRDAQRINGTNQSLLAQLDAQAFDIALSRKEQVYATAAGSFRSFPAGTMSPRMIQQAMLDHGPVARGGTPGEDERALRKAAVADAESAIREVHPTRSGSNNRWNSSIERASIEIAGGDLEVASALIDDVEQEYGPESPEVMNLRALHSLAQADNGEDTLEQAADQFKKLTERHPEFAQGWFNYALLVTRIQGLDESRSLWNAYLKVESSLELREAVQTQLDLLSTLR